MAYKTFANGFPLPASDLNNYLMNQSVIVFADSTARSAALPTPTEGMITYLEDTNLVEVYNGSAWADINDNTAAIPKSTVTTAGDLIVADGASSVTRLGVGTDDQVLTVVSGEPAWADAGGGGGGKTSISTQSLTGATTITFSSIPATYKDLFFVFRGSSTSEEYIEINDNNSANSYWWGGITSQSQFQADTTAFFYLRYNCTFVMSIYDYLSSNTHAIVGQIAQNSSAANGDNRWGFSQTRATGAINSVTFSIGGSGFTGTAELYGVS